ncbi:MAG: hypothetical protein AAB116_14690, partial [Candidatus Poribacteria bacterium]
VLGEPALAEKLLENIRYWTGLLIERRSGIFAFAHLTFQEYLAALAVHEGNKRGIDIEKLVSEVNDGRWQEVIPLYCGLAPAPDARQMIERLITKPFKETESALPSVLGEAYLSAGPEILGDTELRHRVLHRILLDNRILLNIRDIFSSILDRFSKSEVAKIANSVCGTQTGRYISSAYYWLAENPDMINWESLMDRIRGWRKLNPYQLADLIVLLHYRAPNKFLIEVADWRDLYSASGPDFKKSEFYSTQAEVAIIGLKNRLDLILIQEKIDSPKEHKKLLGIAEVSELVLLTIMRILIDPKNEIGNRLAISIDLLLSSFIRIEYIPQDGNIRSELTTLSRKLAERLLSDKKVIKDKEKIEEINTAIQSLKRWADYLESGILPKKSDLSSSDKRIRQTNR